MRLHCGPKRFLAENAGAVEEGPSELPDLRITLHGESGDLLCSFNLADYGKTSFPSNPDVDLSNEELIYKSRNVETGWFTRSYIFHNFQPCIPLKWRQQVSAVCILPVCLSGKYQQNGIQLQIVCAAKA